VLSACASGTVRPRFAGVVRNHVNDLIDLAGICLREPIENQQAIAVFRGGYDMLHRYTSLDDRETHFVGRIEAPSRYFPVIISGESDRTRWWLVPQTAIIQ
jgi:hypothetical protein